RRSGSILILSIWANAGVCAAPCSIRVPRHPSFGGWEFPRGGDQSGVSRCGPTAAQPGRGLIDLDVRRRKAPWILMAGGIAINVVGDTANLFASSWGRQGFILSGVSISGP